MENRKIYTDDQLKVNYVGVEHNFLQMEMLNMEV